MRELLKLIAGVPMMFARTVVLDRDERRELARIHASTRRWLDEQPLTAAQPAADLQAEVQRLRYALEGADSVLRAWGTENRFLCEELKRARADVERLTTAHDALDDAALESAEKIKRLREDLAQLHTQKQGGPVAGQWVTLRLEDGTKVTGEFVRDVWGRGFVNGWLADLDGRTWVKAPGGGDGRG